MILSATAEGIMTLANASDYRVTLPDVPINLAVPKSISTSKTIGGGASISVWESSINGEQRTISVLVDRETYHKVKAIHESNIGEWLLRVNGRIYRVIVSLNDEISEQRPGTRIRLIIGFTFVAEETKL